MLPGRWRTAGRPPPHAVVLMHYDEAGQFLGGEALPETETPTYQALAVYDADARQILARLSDEYRMLDH